MLSRRSFVLAAIAANAAPIALVSAAETRTFDSGSFTAASRQADPCRNSRIMVSDLRGPEADPE